MTVYKNRPIKTDSIKRYSLKDRKNKVDIEGFAKKYKTGGDIKDFFDSLPDFLAVRDLRKIASKIADAHRSERAIVLGMGAHPIKLGLSHLIIQWMEKGLLSALAVNGAAMIHDFEIAFNGSTSEDVSTCINDGSFGMALETGKMINEFINEGVEEGLGLGESVGKGFYSSDLKYKESSIFYRAFELKVPITVHVAVGTDIIHNHPEASGAAIGEGSLRDFRLLADCCRELDDGGVFLNLGSAVIIPEVFLKVVTLLRNLGTQLNNLYTLNMDFINQYRPRTNVVQRPTQKGGKGFTLIGHHEIMFPLLTALIMEEIG